MTISPDFTNATRNICEDMFVPSTSCCNEHARLTCKINRNETRRRAPAGSVQIVFQCSRARTKGRNEVSRRKSDYRSISTSLCLSRALRGFKGPPSPSHAPSTTLGVRSRKIATAHPKLSSLPIASASSPSHITLKTVRSSGVFCAMKRIARMTRQTGLKADSLRPGEEAGGWAAFVSSSCERYHTHRPRALHKCKTPSAFQ